jgi:outer membrane protein TolC
MMIPSYSALAQAPSGATEQLNANNLTTLSGGPLSLQQTALITLKNSPNLIMGKLGVQSARAGAQMASGEFDIYVSVAGSGNENRPIFGTDTDTQDLNFALNKGFRTGISTTVSAGITRIDDRLSPVDTTNVSHLNLNITIPLLKGRGYISAAAGETSARLQSQAAELNFYHNISNLLLNSINAYWDYKAAIENLKVQQKSEQRTQNWVDASVEGIKLRYGDVNAFFKSHEAETSRVRGYLADKRRNTAAAIEQVNSTRGALAVVMGIPSEQVPNIGEPSEGFAGDWSETLARLEQQPMQDKWVTKALEKRLDIRAAKLKQEASAVKLAKARQDVLPQLDFGLNAGRNAIELGDGYNRYVDALSSDTRGTDVGVSLTFVYPLGNNLAKGQRDLANATHNINVITTNDLMRTISVQVGVDAGALMRRLKEAVEALQAVKLYGIALEKSYSKSRDSLLDDPNTIFNLMDLDEKLTEASNNLVNSLQELAKAIAQLRFQTGTLLIGGSMDTEKLELGELSKIPGM